MSILGTLGPLVQGPSTRRTDKIRTATVFSAAFLAGAVAIFASVKAVGAALGAANLPIEWRLGFASAGLLTLAVVDVLAIRKSRYCPLGLRRQTPKALMRRRSATVVAAVWGFDTGLTITTFRVAAVTWGALVLAGFSLSPWWAGLGYGLGFTVPFFVLLFTHRVGRAARQAAPMDPGLESMLGKRAAIQGLSAALLALGGGILIGSWMA